MEHFGIVDIGSNTVVLVVYSYDNGVLKKIKDISTPVGLVGSIHNGHLDSEAIQRASEVLVSYRNMLKDENIANYWAFMTEPARGIDNLPEVRTAFLDAGFQVQFVSGRQEAEYDFYGCRLDSMDYSNALVTDIGGGSTELVRYMDSKIIEAVSLPIGCVRCSVSSDPDLAKNTIEKASAEYPLLHHPDSSQLIGVGGTIRAMAKLSEVLYHTTDNLSADDFRRILNGLINQDRVITAAMQKQLNPSRQKVIIPGAKILEAILDQFHITSIHVSQNGVREGFLIRNVLAEFH